MNWFDCLEAFVKVSEAKSFIQAARALNTTNSVITKRIKWLEDKLATTLFIRTTRKVTLTEMGEALYLKTNPLLTEWQDIQMQLLDQKEMPQGEITICFPPNVSSQPLFIAMMSDFLHRYPKLHLHIINSANPVNLVNDKIDILIATENYLLDKHECVAMKLFDFSYGAYLSKKYLKQHTEPNKPLALKDHACIVYRADDEWEFAGKKYQVTGKLRADAADTMIPFCLRGDGIIYMPPFMLENELRAGTLKPILENYPGKKGTLSAFYPRHDYKPRKIVLFLQFLKEYLTEMK